MIPGTRGGAYARPVGRRSRKNLAVFLAVLGAILPVTARAQIYYLGSKFTNDSAVITAAITCDATATGTIRYNTGNSSFEGCNGTTWGGIGSGGASLNGITAATASQAGIANGAYSIQWNWDTLAAGNALVLSSSGTAGLTGQTLLNISATGANGTTGQTTYGEAIANTHTGTGTNVGLYATASGGTNNYAALFPAGNVGIGTATPAAALDVQTGVTAAAATAYGSRLQQTLTAAADNDSLTAMYINPTFTDNAHLNLAHSVLTINAGTGGASTVNDPVRGLKIKSTGGYGDGVAFYSGTSAKIGYIQYTDTANSWSTGAGDLIFAQASASNQSDWKMVINNAGKVGIGGTFPTALLHVAPLVTANYPALRVTGAVNTTNQATGVESPDIDLALARVETWATGALATQEAVKIAAPTYAFAGASTLTNAATLGITGAPVEGTLSTITNSHALLISGGAATGATNAYGLSVNAPTGATNNYAAQFMGGNVGIGTAAPAALLDIGAVGATLGTLRLESSTAASYVQFQPSTTAGSATYTLPPSAPGTSGYVLSSTTAGVMSWVSAGGGAIGTTTQVAFNNTGTESGSADFLWNDSAKTLTVDAANTTGATLAVGVSGANMNKISVGPTTGLAAPAGLALSNMSDTSISAPASGQSLTYNGASWVNGSASSTTGTFTPTYAGTTTAGACTYTTQVGTYTTVGKLVIFSVHLLWSACGTAPAGAPFLIKGLPFTSNNTANLYQVTSPPLLTGTYAISTNSMMVARIPPNTTQIELKQITTTIAAAAISDLAVDTAAEIMVSGSYIAN